MSYIKILFSMNRVAYVNASDAVLFYIEIRGCDIVTVPIGDQNTLTGVH